MYLIKITIIIWFKLTNIMAPIIYVATAKQDDVDDSGESSALCGHNSRLIITCLSE